MRFGFRVCRVVGFRIGLDARVSRELLKLNLNKTLQVHQVTAAVHQGSMWGQSKFQTRQPFFGGVHSSLKLYTRTLQKDVTITNTSSDLCSAKTIPTVQSKCVLGMHVLKFSWTWGSEPCWEVQQTRGILTTPRENTRTLYLSWLAF